MNIFRRLAQKWTAARLEYRGRCLLAHGHPAEAMVPLEALRRLELCNPYTNYLLAQAYIGDGRHADALDCLRRVAENWPDDPPTWYAIGACCDYLDKQQEAIIAYQRTLSLAPHWVVTLKHLGRCAWRLGDASLATRALAHYCSAVPDDTEAHDLLGYLAYEQGHLRDAFSHYIHASQLDPANPKLDRNARILYHRSATS